MPDSDANVWAVPAGLDAEFAVFPYDSGGSPVVMAGTEVLTVQAWQGDDTAPAAGLASAAWKTPDGTDQLPGDWPPAAPYVVASVLGPGTSGMAQSYHLLRISAVSGGKARELLTTWLHVGDSPGVAAPPVTCCTLQDMLDVGGGWLPKLMMESGRTDFLAERARAASQFRKVVLARGGRRHCGFDPGSYDGSWTSPDAPDSWLSGLIDAGGIVMDDESRAAVACLAVAYVCERSLTWEADDPMARRAGAFHRRWRAALPGLSVGIDSDADGIANHWVDLSVIP